MRLRTRKARTDAMTITVSAAGMSRTRGSRRSRASQLEFGRRALLIAPLTRIWFTPLIRSSLCPMTRFPAMAGSPPNRPNDGQREIDEPSCSSCCGVPSTGSEETRQSRTSASCPRRSSPRCSELQRSPSPAAGWRRWRCCCRCWCLAAADRDEPGRRLNGPSHVRGRLD